MPHRPDTWTDALFIYLLYHVNFLTSFMEWFWFFFSMAWQWKRRIRLKCWTRQLKQSSFGEEPLEENQTHFVPNFGWKAELDKGKNPPGGKGTVRKESERTLLEIGFKGCNWQVSNPPVGRDSEKRIWTQLCSKWGGADEPDKANNLAVGRDPHKRIRSHFVPNRLELLITRQVKLSICGKGSRDKNQNAVCSKWGWTAEFTRLVKESENVMFQTGLDCRTRQIKQSFFGKRTTRKESERTLFQMGLNDWTRQVKQSSCEKGPWDRKQNALCSKWGTLGKQLKRTLF